MTELTGALEVLLGGVLMLVGLLLLVLRVMPRRLHRYGILALLLAVVALVEAQKRPGQH